jgi:hypothetical protein
VVNVETKQREHDERCRRVHGRKMRSEYTTTPKQVTIVNPAPAQVYGGSVEVVLQLSGVPLSYLGRDDDEQQRVLLFVNGELIAADALTVEAAPTAPPVANLPSALPALTNGTTKATLRLPARALDRAAPIARASTKGGVTTTITTTVANVLPGRPFGQSKRARFAQGLPSGTTIRFRPNADQLQVGSNSVVAIVVDPNGQRYQHAVTFGVPARKKVPGSGVRLPGIPGRPVPARPTLRRNKIDLHLDREAVDDRLRDSKHHFTEHTRKRLTTLAQVRNADDSARRHHRGDQSARQRNAGRMDPTPGRRRR